MITRGSPQMLHAREAALNEYLEALLGLGGDAQGDRLPPVGPDQNTLEADAKAAVEYPMPTVAGPDPVDGDRATYRVCSVAGVRLAVPAHEIEAEHRLDRPLLPVSGAPSWCLGAIDTADRHCHVVDLAKVVAPSIATRAAPTVALALVGGDWMLACDALGEAIELARDDVRWRELAGDRPWLAGTAMERRCAVLDVRGLSGQLSREMAHG